MTARLPCATATGRTTGVTTSPFNGSAESQTCWLRRLSRATVSRTCFSACSISSPGVRIAFSQASTARSGPFGRALPGADGNSTAMPSIGSSGSSPLALPCQGLSRPALRNSKAPAGRATISGSIISSRSTAPSVPFCVDSRKLRFRCWMAWPLKNTTTCAPRLSLLAKPAIACRIALRSAFSTATTSKPPALRASATARPCWAAPPIGASG